MLIGTGSFNRKSEQAVGVTVAPVSVNLRECEVVKVTAAFSREMLAGKCAALVNLHTDGDYECTFTPHQTPCDNMVIGEKAMRGAPIILEKTDSMFILLPDFDAFMQPHPAQFIMDYSKAGNVASFGIGAHKEVGHVYYKLTGEELAAEDITVTFYAAKFSGAHEKRDYRRVVELIWELFTEQQYSQQPPEPDSLTAYVKHVYNWAFANWKDICWQEFEVDGVPVGGMVFIVTAKQKPGHGSEDVWREPKSLWNQAWFCSLRSAYGYYNWGKKNGQPDLMEKARLNLNFALMSPQQDGFIYSYYKAGEGNDFTKGAFGQSCPRRPDHHDNYFHLLDNSWTCYWLCKWYTDNEADERILPYVTRYVDAILKLQQPDGSFPAWVEPISGAISPYLQKSPEVAAHIMLLCKLYEITKNERYLASAKAAAAFIISDIIPSGKWEDFETYWSCAELWSEKQFGCVDKKSGVYSQNTFGMYFCADGLLSLYQLTGEKQYLEAGEVVLAEMSLYQQVYRPAGFPVPTIGGFGVMNCDDEWNDARQSLFALTYLRYYKETKSEAYRLRAVWAMKASFYMMFCPENPEVKALYEKVHPHLDERDYGFHMENFNHSDGTQKHGLGEFTIFDWGNGAASSSLYEFIKLYN